MTRPRALPRVASGDRLAAMHAARPWGIGRDPTGLRPGGTLAATGFPAGPVEGDVLEVLDRMHERVGTLRRDDAPDTVVPVAESAGFELVARIDEPGRPVSPRSEADLIEARSQARTWSIDDKTWAGVVEPALARIRALPDQDRVRPGPGPTILAFRRS